MSAFGPRDILLACAMVLTWGSNYAIAKLGLHAIPPFLFMVERFVLTAVLLGMFIRIRRPPWAAMCVYAGVVGVLHFGCTFFALRSADAATVIIVSQASVPLTALLGAVFLREPVTVRQVLGICLAAGGVAVAAGGASLSVGATTFAIILVGAAAWSVGTVWMKARLPIDGTQINFWTSVLAAPPMLALSAALGEDPVRVLVEVTPVAAASVAYQAVFTVIIGYGIWNLLVRRHEVRLVSPLTMLVPPTGVAVAFLLLGEVPNRAQVLGGLLTMSGVALVLAPPGLIGRYQRRRAA